MHAIYIGTLTPGTSELRQAIREAMEPISREVLRSARRLKRSLINQLASVAKHDARYWALQRELCDVRAEIIASKAALSGKQPWQLKPVFASRARTSHRVTQASNHKVDSELQAISRNNRVFFHNGN